MFVKLLFVLAMVNNLSLVVNCAIDFRKYDLEINYDRNVSVYSLQAFKDENNDKILNENRKEKYSLLTWYTLGLPRIVLTNKAQLFSVMSTRVFFVIETLQPEIQTAFVDEVQRKYSVKILKSQIQKLPLNKFECTTTIYNNGHDGESDGEGENLVFSVTDFNKPSYTLNLKPSKTKSLKTIQESLAKYFESNKQEMHFECSLYNSKGFNQTFWLVYSNKIKKEVLKFIDLTGTMNKKLDQTKKIYENIQSETGQKASLEIEKILNRLEKRDAGVKNFGPKLNEFKETLDKIEKEFDQKVIDFKNLIKSFINFDFEPFKSKANSFVRHLNETLATKTKQLQSLIGSFEIHN